MITLRDAASRARVIGIVGIVAALLAGFVVGQPGRSGAASIAFTPTLTQANDDMRTGWYPNQLGLTPSLVTGGTFGPMWDGALDAPTDGLGGTDQVYGQPLVTAAGTVVVATEANKLYGFDAVTGARRYKTDLGAPFDPATIPCSDLTPRIGITSTPAIDAGGTAYVVAKEVSGGATNYRAYAYDANNGGILWSTTIAGTAQNAPGVAFDARIQLQRPGLLLQNGVLYSAYGAHCDEGNYRGWVVGIDVNSHQIVAMWASQPGGTRGAGIWQAGAGIMSDGAGRLFVTTGNSFEGRLLNGDPAIADTNPPAVLGEAVVRLDVQGNRTLGAGSFFVPYDVETLDNADLDFGSGGAVGVPSTALAPGSSSSNVLVAVGKQGYVYLLDRDHLGGFKQGGGGGDASISRVGPDGGVWSKPTVWPGESGDGGYVYVVTSTTGTSPAGSAGYFNTYKLVRNASGGPGLQRVAQSPDTFGFGSGAPIVTSNGTQGGTGIVWTIWSPGPSGDGAELRAYRAVPDGGQLDLLRSWPIGQASKFAPPVASGSHIFVGTRDGHVRSFGSPVSQPLAVTTPTFPTTTVGASSTQPVTITANSALTVNGVTSSNQRFAVGAPSVALPVTLAAGASLTIPITFTPTAGGPAGATLTIGSSAGEVSVPLAGRGQLAVATLAVNPAALSLGGAVIGTQVSGSIAVSNVGATALTISNVVAPGDPFSIAAFPVPYTLPPGVSVQIAVTYAPTTIGDFQSSITIASDGGTAVVPVTGSAAMRGQRTITPPNVAFRDTFVNGRRSSSFALGNTGGSAYTVSISKPPALHQFVANASSLPEGSAVAAGATRVIPVAFAPTSAASYKSGWDLSTTDGSKRTVVGLTGTGIPSRTLTAPSAAWTVNGNAAITADGTLRLTDAVNDQAGSAFANEALPTDKLEAHFTAFLDGNNGGFADGMTFAVVDATTNARSALGKNGGGLGFNGLTNGIGVGLVSYNGGGTSLAGVLATTASGDNKSWLADPVDITPILHSDATDGRPVPVDVWIDTDTAGQRVLTVDVAGIRVVTDLPVNIPARAYVGFTGATGGLVERHAVRDVKIIVPGTDGLCPSKTDPATLVPCPEVLANDTTRLVALNPTRIYDTRPAPERVNHTGDKPAPASTINVPVLGRGGVPDSGVGAVMLNVTATAADGPGYVTVWPSGVDRPLASNLNVVRAGQTVAALVTVPVGADGSVNVFTQGGADLVVDAAGWLPSGAGYGALTPTRIFDTRPAPEQLNYVGGKPAAGADLTVGVLGVGGVPASGVTAAVLTVTATEADAAGYVTAWPSGTARPLASNMNLLGAGHTVANQVIVPVGSDGKIELYTQSSAHLVVDVAGYFTDTASVTPLPPARLLDTRPDPERVNYGGDRPGAGATVLVPLAGHGGIPASGASLAILNVTATNTRGAGYVAIWPSGSEARTASILNATTGGETIANLVVVPIGADGNAVLYTQGGADLVVDVAGWGS